jgi:catechol 2,3-dioxygenase-like lactoylglutathione lyase family enzyme
MNKLRHIALSVADAEATAQFYEKTFGMERVVDENTPSARAIMLSDGVVNLAILDFKNDSMAGAQGKDYVGVHHLGFQVDDLDDTQARIEGNGGSFYGEIPMARDTKNYEMKFLDPNGIMIDISQTGWVGSE